MDEKDKHIQELQKALERQEIPTLYFNGFTASIGAGDVIIVLKQQNEPVLILNASHIVAKTLVVKLGAILTEIEQRIGSTFMTTDDFDSKMKESNDNEDNN